MMELNWTAVTSALIYVFTALIVSSFALKPIASIIEERKKRKEVLHKEIAEGKIEIERIKEEYRNRILKAEQEIKAMMERKMEEVRNFEKEEMEKLRAKTQEKLKKMREMIALEVEELRKNKERIAMELAEIIVEKILEGK
jgi:F0F1-type ATP synthase membrane subunit b/b'